MPHHLISFPSRTMELPEQEMAAVGDASRAVIQELKDAGVYVFGGGLDEEVAPVTVAADGSVTPGSSPETKDLDDGITVRKLSSWGRRWSGRHAGWRVPL